MDWASDVIGREAELSGLERFLSAEGFAVLALEGEPGIGKTTVWQAGVRRARALGYRVLACRAAQAETRLSFVGLVDLLSPVPEEAIAVLPEPQRRVLEVVLLRAGGGELRPDRATICVAVLSLLRVLAAERPLLVAVDDAQWLDAPSASVLEFAARRLDREHVRMVVSLRLSGDPAQTFDCAGGARRESLRVGPLSVGALHELIRQRLGRAFARPTLIKLARVSAGNPFYALEVARALHEGGEPRAGEPLPVPEDLATLVRGRIRRLPARSREALLVASALPVPTLELVGATAIAPAERADMVRVLGDDRVEFTHPLFASAVYSSVSTADRRAIHRGLAGLVVDAEERARHLALAADGPDEQVAVALEAGAVTARSRGAWETAAELMERACELTPTDHPDHARWRAIRAAECHVHAGDRPRGRMLLDRVLAQAMEGDVRAEALGLLAQIKANEESFPEAGVLLEEALTYANDQRLMVSINTALSFVRANMCQYDDAAILAERARVGAEATGDMALLAEALAYCAMMGYLAGHGVDWDAIERGLRLEDPDRVASLLTRPRALHGFLLLYVGRLAEARRSLSDLCQWARDRGDESDLAFVLWWLVWLETLSGNYSVAAAHADEAERYAAMTGSRTSSSWVLAQRALLLAHMGDLDGARRDCDAADALVAEVGWTTASRWSVAARCLLELSADDFVATWRAAQPLAELAEAHGIGEPVDVLFLPDALEALIAIGDLDRADTLLEAFDRRARELDRVWALATGRRCGGLLLAARGDLAGAEEAIERALVEHERLEMPFERARTLLCLGRVQRRRKQRKAARATLEAALEIFAGLGTSPWAEKTRAELERTHVRQAPQSLTPSEEQVVHLAASGMRNREIADRLYLSPKTVEANLARAYRKLGVRSRAELGAAINAEATTRSS
ncbi:MAG TPA: AAA family ATPase [Solirubrobacteraceae bacterium]|nr:AAA family ATPase [Solirubrobacteraceae bacterium]